MAERPKVTERQQQILRMLTAEKLASVVNPGEFGGLRELELAQQLGASENEVRADLRALADLGFIEHVPVEPGAQGNPFRQDESGYPDGIRDADTSPDTWLHARDRFEPLAAAQCYPYIFRTLLDCMEDSEATTVGALNTILSDDNWLEFVQHHGQLLNRPPNGPLEFFVDELIEQMLHRINQRYPAAEGYSPLLIALVALYRAMRAAHDEVEAEAS